LHTDDLISLAFVCQYLKKLEKMDHVARMGEMRNACSILVIKHDVKRPLGRYIRRWEGNVRIGFREIGWDIVGWMHLARG
jgi:hypothetical protein